MRDSLSFLLAQAPPSLQDTQYYSIGLFIVCLTALMVLFKTALEIWRIIHKDPADKSSFATKDDLKAVEERLDKRVQETISSFKEVNATLLTLHTDVVTMLTKMDIFGQMVRSLNDRQRDTDRALGKLESEVEHQAPQIIKS